MGRASGIEFGGRPRRRRWTIVRTFLRLRTVGVVAAGLLTLTGIGANFSKIAESVGFKKAGPALTIVPARGIGATLPFRAPSELTATGSWDLQELNTQYVFHHVVTDPTVRIM